MKRNTGKKAYGVWALRIIGADPAAECPVVRRKAFGPRWPLRRRRSFCWRWPWRPRRFRTCEPAAKIRLERWVTN